MTSIPVKWRQQFAIDLPDASDDCIWIHACSVGEVGSIAPLVRALIHDHFPVHLTVITETGMRHAQRLFGDAINISYLPWDIPGLIARCVARLSPRLLLLTETEFWPGLISACKRRNIPVISLNTRISDRSFPRYHASRMLWRRWLKPVALFIAQSETDAARLTAIGADKDRIQVLGHLKYAISPPKVDADVLRKRLDPSGKRPIVLAASTHDEEERHLLSMWQGWRRLQPDILLVIVPRHPQRFDEVAELVRQQGLNLAHWSETGQTHADVIPRADVILIDAMGVLAGLYTVADLVIVGGSLIPHGGQNPLEAAVCGRGVVTGPHVQNFRSIMRDMQQTGAAIVTANAEELDMAVKRMLERPDELRQLNAKSAAFMQGKSQVLERVLRALQPYLGKA